MSFTALGFSLCRPYKEVDQLQELYIKALLCEIGDNERSAFKGTIAPILRRFINAARQ
jgi:hypothetical protein